MEQQTLNGLSLTGCPRCMFQKIKTSRSPAISLAVSQQGHKFASDEERRLVSSKLYQPIHPWQTRIIVIHPGEAVDPLDCELQTVDLIAKEGVVVPAWSSIVFYDALSYSWGYPEPTAMIKCNGTDVPVTQNMVEALVCLRYRHGSRHVWIDAFCINQFDIAEKSTQVQDMMLIFTKAERVIVWLGLPSVEECATYGLLAIGAEKETIEKENSRNKTIKHIIDLGR
ncbi:uncharacterized protein Z519_05037 [Cladophialophora bantiana CBS 173.52]|uniref:Heterokaryon incompatibility domain-containing protein n=1 Tax=Cladophialophora bantiana (strain ATCC 10958 / CBS 173.52 / CDC B-1940 / NIH 8579) TaxID=1442370 RepID=A0A0D2HKB6_CLAB1|nr:uncharacterized protein Z519_05037 [Cladophialophora bantiana CBS 173.52]KIW93723.1 hypothetical protein Z519_05037 [Cladophialophora bantiana CBS 173.52]